MTSTRKFTKTLADLDNLANSEYDYRSKKKKQSAE